VLWALCASGPDEGSEGRVPQIVEVPLNRARRVRDALRLAPGPVDLAAIDPGATPGLPLKRDESWARAQLPILGGHLESYQERLFAAGHGGDHRSILVVLQAMDCGGKDGTIKGVIAAMNPQGVKLTAFGPPTAEERGHHFLWRIRAALPTAGLVGVFNRSHYEDVLVVRVHRLVAEDVWRHRYDEINAFEQELVDQGVTLVKIMLHISYEEQRTRLLARLDDPTKRWKFRPADLDDRSRWPQFQAAYADALTRCAGAAPWYVVPADRKWYRNWAVAHLLLATFCELDPAYPVVNFDIEEQRRRLTA
jgi:PPK2 family polyphosphate:nucleotide phosphotransferase